MEVRVLSPVLKALGMCFSPSDGEENTQHSPQGLGWHRARDRGPQQPSLVVMRGETWPVLPQQVSGPFRPCQSVTGMPA